MSRLGLLASSALIAMASAAHSATVKFEALREGTKITSLTCGTSNCARLKANVEIKEKDLPSATLGPAFTFDFIEFETKGNSRKNPNPSGNFGITAKLAFRIIGVPDQVFEVLAKGLGQFSISGEKITSLTLDWDKIDNVVIPNVGTLAFRFSNINLASAFANRDTNDSNGSRSTASSSSTDDLLTVSATVENVSVVPLPGGVVLLLSALGLIGIGAARRSRTAA